MMKNFFDKVTQYFIGEDYEDDMPETEAGYSEEKKEPAEKKMPKFKFQMPQREEKPPRPEKERAPRFSSDSARDTSMSGKYSSSSRDAGEKDRRSSRLVNMSSAGTAGQSNMIITQISDFSDCKDIVKQLRERKSVIINVDQLDKVNARRSVDFLSGAVTAIDGTIKKVSGSIIVVAPNNVKLTGIFGEEVPSNINDSGF